MSKNTKGIFIRVTEEEYQELIRQKDYMHLPSYSSLIRMYINNAVCFNVNFDGLFETSTQIARVGNNINQIARAVNETHSITSYQVELLKKHMDELEKIVGEMSNKKVSLTKYIAREQCGGGNLGNYKDNKSKNK